MEIKLNSESKVLPGQTDSYMTFRMAIPKPSSEYAHLRHILRFYIARALQKRGEEEVYLLPTVTAGDKSLILDVAGKSKGKYTLAVCEPGSVTPETEDMLEVLKDVEGIEVLIVHSQFGKPGNVMTRFKPEIETKKFSLLAVVPPPFDDVYEYDIWMFETTFRDLFERG
jgi:hypothetical protein